VLDMEGHPCKCPFPVDAAWSRDGGHTDVPVVGEHGPCLPAFSCRRPHLQHVGAFTSESIFFLFDFLFFFLKCHCLELNHLVCSECYFNRAARKTGVPLQNQEPQTMSCVPGNGRKESHSDQL